jgi:hypothetical protein
MATLRDLDVESATSWELVCKYLRSIFRERRLGAKSWPIHVNGQVVILYWLPDPMAIVIRLPGSRSGSQIDELHSVLGFASQRELCRAVGRALKDLGVIP